MSETPADDASEADLAKLRVGGTVKASAALSGMSGAIALLTGIQFTTSAEFYEPLLNAVPWSLSGLGAVQLGLALMVLRNHFPAVVAATAVGVLVAVCAAGWALLAAAHEFVSCLAICEVPLAGSAAVVTPFAIEASKRAWDAKKRLADSGLELGL